MSETTSFALSDLPAQPLAPVKNLLLSTTDRIVIDWSFVADTQMPGGLITNYQVLMDTNISGDFKVIYTASASLKNFAVDFLQPGTLYRFKIQAKNFNGWGPESPVGQAYTCVKPSTPAIPKVIATSSNTMTFEWTAPEDDGACPIISYAVFRDDGITGIPLIEINSDNDLNVRNKPTLRTVVA